jgi:MurNAc alpha-1-phosphate uridylyltransferase
MQPITDTLPKPLIEVSGRSLLDRALDRLVEEGIEDVVINAHYLGEQVVRHLETRERPRIRISLEETLLETGGGVLKALPLLGPGAFFVVNGDVLWDSGINPPLKSLAGQWNSERMDGLLLMQTTVGALGYEGWGDFNLEPSGLLTRREAPHIAPFLFAGLCLLHPRIFSNAPDGAFSLNVLFDRAIEHQRLYGLVHKGGWCHVGEPDHLPLGEAFVDGRLPQTIK